MEWWILPLWWGDEVLMTSSCTQMATGYLKILGALAISWEYVGTIRSTYHWLWMSKHSMITIMIKPPTLHRTRAPIRKSWYRCFDLKGCEGSYEPWSILQIWLMVINHELLIIAHMTHMSMKPDSQCLYSSKGYDSFGRLKQDNPCKPISKTLLGPFRTCVR